MEARERELVLILADISGYTRFMLENQTAAVHGQLCITTLIETMLRQVDIPLQLQEIEGDALFLYAAHPGDTAGWQECQNVARNWSVAIDRGGGDANKVVVVLVGAM